MTEATKSDKIRQLSQEQQNAVEHLLQGKSDKATAEAVGVTRQTIWEWRNKNVVFIAELNLQRFEMWEGARERMKALANRALDVVETQLDSGDPKASLAAAKYVLQGTRLLGDTDLPRTGPTTPEGVIFDRLKAQAWAELNEKADPTMRSIGLLDIDDEAEALARKSLKKALAEEGLS